MSSQLQTIESSQEKINLAFAQADHIVMRKYMPKLCSYPLKEADAGLKNSKIHNFLRLNKIEKIVYDSDENNLDKLMNVYHSVALCRGAVVQIILSDGESVACYLGIRTANMNDTAMCQSALAGTFEGNFPGSKMVCQLRKEADNCLEKVFVSETGEKDRVISIVSGIPGFRSESNKEFVQGMEKLIDSMDGKKYALVTIAEPVNTEQMMHMKENYEDLYSQLSPFSKITQSHSESDSNAIAESISDTISQTVGSTVSDSESQSEGKTEGTNASIGGGAGIPYIASVNLNIGKSWGTSTQHGTSHGTSSSTTEGTSKTSGSTETYTATTGQTMQLSYENKRVTDLLKQIEKQIERIEDAKDMGLWNTAAYCLADDVQTSKILAGAYQSLCRGKKNTVETYSINTWMEQGDLGRMGVYLRNMHHPRFEMTDGGRIFEFTPASFISGRELVISAGLPQKSINGMPVSTMASFARNVVIEGEKRQGENICIGNIYHMGNTENTEVKLDSQSLSSHVLITGSTGSGKSNTVYSLILELRKKGKKFLIIEPAKGEYKHVFGNAPDVHVFGTNRNFSELLRIDPFSFPKDIHILEHIDRLIEIFNVCWPMYAAMPAVLKDAVLRAYRKCGWNLDTSENMYGVRYYPTCMDISRQVIQVIESSAYSEEVRGNYIGSLATRIQSLTNGINGQMFVSDEIDEKTLFDENTIIDLSRVGSQETKALIMGILVMKLSEYRMSDSDGKMNQPLKHVTVLEEAHNLLKNSGGAAKSSEEGDMAGKSVEMISNSIAEVRTYGEGFIIVDQSPGAIDISAIRNTNTKILMRLPEAGDRKQAGSAAALTEKQIAELAKLPKGVAVVYQNNWLDPVLCKIKKAEVLEMKYQYCAGKQLVSDNEKELKKMIVMLLVGNRVDESLDIDPDRIRTHILGLHISTKSRILIENAIVQLESGTVPAILKEDSFEELSRVVCEVIDYDSFQYLIESVEDEQEVQRQIAKILAERTGPISHELEFAAAQCIIRKLVSDDESKMDLYGRWREFAVEQREVEKWD